MSELAIAAATVIIVRDASSGWEVLLLQRHTATAFAGGAMVFPGGRVDPGDSAVAADPDTASGFASLDAIDAAARVAAAREAFEEADVLLTRGVPINSAYRAAWRTRLNAGTMTWHEVLGAAGSRLDAAMLLPFAHWVPPAAAPITRRFDTLFYLARLPPGEAVTPDGGEAVAARWMTPAAALAAADRGEIALLFPTSRNLERLAQYATPEALFFATAARPLVRIQPAIVARDGADWLTIPVGCDYPIVAERLEAARRG